MNQLLSFKLINIDNTTLSNELNISSDLQDYNVHQSLLYKVIYSLICNSKRIRSSHYKCKSGIIGSGKKIRPQKGTGKSRQGTCKEIHMRGGAVKFGYTGNKVTDFPKRYKSYKLLNKKEKKQVFLFLIADKLRNNSIFIVENISQNLLDFKNFIKEQNTKHEKLLFVYNNTELQYKHIFSNLYLLSYCETNLNILDLFYSSKVIFSRQVLLNIVNFFNNFNKSKVCK